MPTRGPKASEQSLDTEYNCGFIAGQSAAWQDIYAGMQMARDRMRVHVQRARAENIRLSSKIQAA